MILTQLKGGEEIAKLSNLLKVMLQFREKKTTPAKKIKAILNL